MNVILPTFGRSAPRPDAPASAAAQPAPGQAAPRQPMQVEPQSPPATAIPHAPTGQLRTACLAQLDPAAIANMSSDQLYLEVERVLAEIATARHFQLNAREQRQLAGAVKLLKRLLDS